MSLLTRTAKLVSSSIGRNTAAIQRLRPSYEWLLNASSGGRGAAWSVNGERVRIDPRVRSLVASETEPELWEYLRGTMQPGDAVLDVGAFLGIYAILLARWGGPSTRVLAFEPTPSSVHVLYKHLDLNRVADQVTVVSEAVGEAPGSVELHLHSEPYRNAVGVTDPAGAGAGSTRVPVTTLDLACDARAFRPTLLRMDVQGFEYAILRGARRTIAENRGRMRIVLEVHPQLWPMMDIDERKFDALLEELGLRARPLRAGGPRYEPDGHVELLYV
jgi:FkbM family methyltransferase